MARPAGLDDVGRTLRREEPIDYHARTRMAELLRRPLVLVVDDEESIVSAYTETLQLDGYETMPASSAEHGLRLLDEGLRPDAVMLDLRMPGMGGLGFLLSLRAHPERRLIPVAVVTADTHLDDTAQHAVQALGADLCFKPLNMQEVLALAARLIAANRHPPPGRAIH